MKSTRNQAQRGEAWCNHIQAYSLTTYLPILPTETPVLPGYTAQYEVVSPMGMT